MVGCGTAFLAIKPILEFAYKVYSEQFSPNARSEQKLEKIKVRKEYLNLLKAAKESDEIKDFNIEDQAEILSIVADLDRDIKELYTKNPYVRLNDNYLGCIEMKDKNIPIELLKAADYSMKNLDELEIESMNDLEE